MYFVKIHLSILILFTLSSRGFTVNRTFRNKNTIIFVILKQPSEYHEHIAQNLIDNVKEQIQIYEIKIPIIFHQINEFKEKEAWTFIPLFEILNELYRDNFEWILFCEERTQINLLKLLILLNKYEPDKDPIWIGHALFDQEASIIHHFQFHQNPTSFKYPNAASGFIMNRPFFQNVLNQISTTELKEDFSIDASYELALFIWKTNNSLTLKHEQVFCDREMKDCATYPLKYQPCNYNLRSSILFAVKTCKQFHPDRISVVKETWGKYYDNIIYFSNDYDASIPTIKLNTTNVKEGHCKKTKSILKYVYKNFNNNPTEWIAIVDDDTIIRLQQFLSCFNSTKPKAIGQRYGYGLTTKRYSGYNYITGGGGIVISRPLLNLLVENDNCICPTSSTADDMYIFGICLAHLDIPIIHSSLFHQARPSDYAPGYLMSDSPISFHKHWMVDPLLVYKEWFEKNDYEWYVANTSKTKIREDL